MALMLFTVFLDLLGIGLIFPIGPFYASAFGASAFDVGLLFTMFSVAQFLTIPILGAPAQCCHAVGQPNTHVCAAPINFMGFNFQCP